MKNGYDDFFKAAKSTKVEGKNDPHSNLDSEIDLLFKNSKRNAKAGKKKRKKSITPWFSLLFAGFIVGIFAWMVVVDYPIDELFSKIEVSYIGSLSAKESKQAAKKDSKQTQNAEKKSTGPERLRGPGSVSSPKFSEEEVKHFSNLNKRQRELDQREKELGELEEELHKQKLEIEERIFALKDMRRQIASVLKERVKIDDTKVRKLVEFYSNMKPSKAAKVFGNINEDLAVEILGQMKKKNAADIMNLLEPDKARNLSEKFAGYIKN